MEDAIKQNIGDPNWTGKQTEPEGKIKAQIRVSAMKCNHSDTNVKKDFLVLSQSSPDEDQVTCVSAPLQGVEDVVSMSQTRRFNTTEASNPEVKGSLTATHRSKRSLFTI